MKRVLILLLVNLYVKTMEIEENKDIEYIIDNCKKNGIGYKIIENKPEIEINTYETIGYNHILRLDENPINPSGETTVLKIKKWILKAYELCSEEEKSDLNTKPNEKELDSDESADEYSSSDIPPDVVIIGSNSNRCSIGVLDTAYETGHLFIEKTKCNNLGEKLREISILSVDYFSLPLIAKDIFKNLSTLRINNIILKSSCVLYGKYLPYLTYLVFIQCVIDTNIEHVLYETQTPSQNLLSLQFSCCDMKVLNMNYFPITTEKITILEKDPHDCIIQHIIGASLEYLGIILIQTYDKGCENLLKTCLPQLKKLEYLVTLNGINRMQINNSKKYNTCAAHPDWFDDNEYKY